MASGAPPETYRYVVSGNRRLCPNCSKRSSGSDMAPFISAITTPLKISSSRSNNDRRPPGSPSPSPGSSTG
eukprot:scaffold37072_cov43-Attheya_sp.AAC.1